MKVRDVMKKEVVTIFPQMKYRDAAKLLSERHFSGVPVIDERGKLVGMLSEKNLFRALYPRYQDYLADPELYLDQEAQENRVDEIKEKSVSEFMYREVVAIWVSDSKKKHGQLAGRVVRRVSRRMVIL